MKDLEDLKCLKDLSFLTEAHVDKIGEWLLIPKEAQVNVCPFGSFKTCSICEDIFDYKCDDECPCTKFGLHYVIKVVEEILRRWK